MRETVVPMSVFTDDGWTLAERDEFLRPDTTLEGLADLRTPFRAGGRVTAGNSRADRRRDRRLSSRPARRSRSSGSSRSCGSSASPTQASSRADGHRAGACERSACSRGTGSRSTTSASSS
jgi:hypothetical protein